MTQQFWVFSKEIPCSYVIFRTGLARAERQ